METGEQKENLTKPDQVRDIVPPTPKPTPEEVQKVEEGKREQERTRIKKKIVLEFLEKTRGVVVHACEKAEISKETFYQWRKNDPDFAAALERITVKRMEDVEDLLMGKIFVEHDGPCIRYWLDRKHPGYKPRNVTEVVTGEKTLEDLLDEAGGLLEDDEEKENDAKPTTKALEAGAHPQVPADQGQAGTPATV